MAKCKKNKQFFKILCVLTISIIAFITIVGVGGFYFLTKDLTIDESTLSLNHNAITFLDNTNQEIIDQNGKVDLSEIPKHTINAFIAKEDKRFFDHSGVDYIRILGALKNNIKNGSIVEGGSTITQQLIKNTQLTPDKTIKRKLSEIKLSLELEKIYSKEEILDCYLNSIYFGNNLFGIKNASSFYFDKQVENLTIAESAILAGIISAPSVYNPLSNIILSKQKAKMVVSLMEKAGFILPEDTVNINQEIDSYEVKNKTSVGAQYMNFASLEALNILGIESFPVSSDISISTFLDYDLQSQIDKMIESEEYKANDGGGAMSDIACMVIENSSGGIIAFGGKSKYNLMELKRQPASTIKPILVYAPAIEENLISPASFVLDEPININGYAPKNATKKNYGYTTIRDNIVRSTNIPAVKILNKTGIEKSKNFAKQLGIKFDTEDNNLALALGGFNSGVSIKDLATAYSTLSRGGNHLETGFVREIKVNGVTVYRKNTNGTQVMKESTAYLITDMLKSVAEYGTGRRINDLSIPIASKTGTNAINDINHDGWNASYTTEHTAVSWMGNTGPVMEFSSSQFNGSLYPTFFVRDVFKELYSDHSPNDFLVPFSVKTVKLDKESYLNHKIAKLSENSTRESILEVFATDNLPPTYDEIPEITLLEEKSVHSNPQAIIDYPRFIRKFGCW